MNKLLIFLCTATLLHAAEMAIELKDDGADYGCGAKTMMFYYPTGIPGGVGCFVGHANPLTRNDRVLMRFDIGGCYLQEHLPAIRAAWLEFSVCSLTYADGQELIVEHLDYERDTIKPEDLASDEATKVAQVPMEIKRFRMDVTAMVRRDLAERSLHAVFRFSSTCGNTGNTTAKPIGCSIRVPCEKAGDNPVLILEY